MSYATHQPPANSGRASVPGPGQPGGADQRVGRASVPTAPAPGRGWNEPPPEQPVRRSRGSGGPPGGQPPALVGKRRKPRWRKVLLSITLVLLLLVGGLFFYVWRLESNLGRVEAFSPITAERPSKPVDGSFNVLVLGSDSRNPDALETGEQYRTDAMMLMHIPANRSGTYLISIPRDLYVYVPPNAEGTDGGYEAKINAATALGGVPLAVQTVEEYTGVRVDNVMVLDFAGFVEVTDAVGGVDMQIEETITSIHGDNRVFEEGDQTLNGEEALDYIRQRKQFADGDFTRMRNQQQFLRSLMGKAASGETLRNPFKLNEFLQATTKTLTVDEEFSLRSVLWKMRNVRGDNMTFLVSPHNGAGNVNGQSVVVSNDEGAAELYDAVRNDRMAQWVANNPDAVGN